MKTAMQELIKYIEEFAPYNKTTYGIWVKAKSLIELEKQQIIDSNNAGWKSYQKDSNQNANDYYIETHI